MQNYTQEKIIVQVTKWLENYTDSWEWLSREENRIPDSWIESRKRRGVLQLALFRDMDTCRFIKDADVVVLTYLHEF